MFHSFFQKIRLDRRRLFDALRFAKFFDAPSRAVERLLGCLRDLASESLDGFDRRGQSLERDIIGRSIDALASGFGLRAGSAILTPDELKLCIKPLS